MILPGAHGCLSSSPLRGRSAVYSRMDERGVTLIELIIVSSILVILAAAAGFTYQGWIGRYKVEKVTKDLHTDLMNARSLALTQNRMYFATLVDANNYSITQDTNDSNTLNAGDTVLPTYPKRVEYAISWDGAAPANQTISFSKRGIINIGGTISFTSPAGVDPDYDCIVISQTRINMGRWGDPVAGVCNEK